jgi:hypothetical protein
MLLPACPGCEPPVVDAGPDSGVVDGGVDDAGTQDDGGVKGDGGVEPQCSENTEGFGEPCAAQSGDPLCGQMLCCTPDIPFCSEGQLLWCYDLGPNDCGGCGDLDTSAGRINESCGEYGCGIVACAEGGTATECVGDRPPNQCGGCLDILVDAGPGDICSACLSGTQTCTRDQNDLVCWRGRTPDNVCGGCDRCIAAHAYMDERFGGGYLRTGTIAIFEDVGGPLVQLSFDPLVEGPGTNGLPWAQLYLSSTENPANGVAVALSPVFAQATMGITADPVRHYSIPFTTIPDTYPYLVLFDLYLNAVISVGLITEGPPPGYPIAGPDAGTASDGGFLDGGGGVVDGGSGTDGGATDAGTTSPDAGVVDGGTSDAGPTHADAGSDDAGIDDAGLADGGHDDSGT